MKLMIRCRICGWETNNANHMGIGHHEISHLQTTEIKTKGYDVRLSWTQEETDIKRVKMNNIWMRLTFNPNTEQPVWESFE